MTDHPSADQTPSGRWLTVSVLLLASMTVMANAAMAPSLPGLRAHFAHIEGIDTLAGLIVTLPSLGIILTAGLIGALADRWDRQKLLLASAACYAIGGTTGLWADDLKVILAGRLLLGLGVAGTMTLTMAWVADLWQGEARARYMGLQGAAMSGGGIVVMILGGALAVAHWRGAFAVYAIVLPITALALCQLAPHARQINTSRRSQRAGGAVVRERAVPEPFPWRAFAVVGPLSLVFMASIYLFPTRLPFVLEEMGVTNSLLAGLIMATTTLASVPGALAYGQLRRVMSAMTIFALAFVLMGIGLLLVGLSQHLGLLILGSVIAGLGIGPAMPNFSTWFMGFVPPSQRGRASGMLTTAFFAGQFISPLISAPLVGRFGLHGAYDAWGIVLALLGAAVWIASVLMRTAGGFARP